MESRKGVYKETIQQDDGTSHISERGFTFQEESGSDYHFSSGFQAALPSVGRYPKSRIRKVLRKSRGDWI